MKKTTTPMNIPLSGAIERCALSDVCVILPSGRFAYTHKTCCVVGGWKPYISRCVHSARLGAARLNPAKSLSTRL